MLEHVPQAVIVNSTPAALVAHDAGSCVSKLRGHTTAESTNHVDSPTALEFVAICQPAHIGEIPRQCELW